MKFTSIVTTCISLFLANFLPLSASAAIVGGNSIIERSGRDWYGDISFIDITHTIQQDSLLTGWNIYAQSSFFTGSSTDPRSIKLIIFRSNNSDFEVVGKSELMTVGQWNQAYHFDLTNPIQVSAGDHIGWYTPYAAIPGGVISFGVDDSGLSLTRWIYGVEASGTIRQSDFYVGEPRIYSINVEGSPVPIPGAAWLLGSGLAVLVGLKRKVFV